MALLKLVTYPDPMLKRISSPVTTIDHNLQEFMKDMVETMYHEEGVGLAAVQVGLLKRIFVIDISDTKDQPMYFINPEITYFSDSKATGREGCLSFPDASGNVTRSEELEIKYLDFNGQPQTLRTDGYLAKAIQHEFDHVNGITYVDHLPLITSTLIKQKVKRAITKKARQ